MVEAQLFRVQQDARGGVVRQLLQPLVFRRAVSLIAHHGMTEVLKMHANLMRAAGVDLHLDVGGALQFLQHAVARVRGPTVGIVLHRHAFAVRGMPGDGGVDLAGVTRDFAADDGVINFFYDAIGKLFRKRNVRFVIFRNHEAAAGFLVEPVDDAGARHAADAAQRTLAMVEQGVDERVFLVAGGGMHDESGGFVDDEQ